MSKHSCPPAEINQVMTATATRRDATTSEKKLITVALADMCAVDMRPFYIVKGTGFRNYTQTVLNIGLNSKVGMLVDNILPDPTTITRNVQMRSNAGREILTATLKVKALVTYVKQANLQDEIAKTLKQENATRWNSALRCMISVDKALPELTEILRARGRGLISKVNKIDHELLKEFIAFLVPFQEAILALEMFAEPMIHHVLYFWQNLLKHCQVVAADITTKEKDGTITTLKKDSPAFIALKPKFAELIREKFIWSDIHVIAALLNPKTKCRLDKFGIDSVDIELGQKNLENMMKDHMIGSSIGKRSVPSHKRKKEDSRRVVRRLAEYSSESDSTIEEKPLADDVQLDFSLRAELNNYNCHRCSDDESTLLSKYGVLFWWKIHQNKFPILSRLARSVLTIPASSAKSESNFSDAGNTMSNKRNLLHPSKLDDLMFLCSMLMSSIVQFRVPPITES
ncbi:hypothetical protein Mp_5g23090 [Marchantia polymorpha subsp. ruderalis]|uniref:HAT C-terminal dimerisation domain-containing protein n=2 Tax=Marchantia polymorpha TaxID=3197 RepID=A0AAF6BLC9_MARPO|nr:hypothetical protein MARPO_0010s0147 [Marchantia polymorpha]BBN12813.1 hypothetical protein Mp_5g23090 [Marchantia polymorpha subsp. ruderalis]|eukprot:PTQ46765.1 hypothetical protein MARPO_0010s0147 [Marchantia polymorpha]